MCLTAQAYQPQANLIEVSLHQGINQKLLEVGNHRCNTGLHGSKCCALRAMACARRWAFAGPPAALNVPPQWMPQDMSSAAISPLHVSSVDNPATQACMGAVLTSEVLCRLCHANAAGLHRAACCPECAPSMGAAGHVIGFRQAPAHQLSG